MSKFVISTGARIRSYYSQISSCSESTDILTNATKDFTSFHAYESTAPSINEVEDDYLKLVYHHLPPITMDIKRLLNAATADSQSHGPTIVII